MWGLRLLIKLISCYTECFRLKTDNWIYFGIFEKYLLRSLTPCPSVSCRCWRPTQIKVKNPLLDLLWRWMQQDSSQHLLDAMCFCPLVWRFLFPAEDCRKFCFVFAQRSSSLWWECWICTPTQCVTAASSCVPEPSDHNGWFQGCWCWVKLGFEAGAICSGSCEGEGTMQGALLGGAGTPTGLAKFLLWENWAMTRSFARQRQVCDRQALTVMWMWGLPVTT